MSPPTEGRPWSRPSSSAKKNDDAPKHCKCIKSKCLQLYCDCYARGETCGEECVCIDCMNTKDRAGRASMGSDVADAKSPKRYKYAAKRKPRELDLAKLKREAGCSCKNSKCLKKYCVCFSAEIECSVGRCNCAHCENPHGKSTGQSSAATKLAAAGVDVPTIKPEDLKCKCAKTSCLKLYCDCFRYDVVCNPECGCIECKNTEEESGPEGARTKAKEEILKTRPNIFQTPKKKSGVGCSCTRNKCITKYCDCNSRGTGCDPAVCTCINCENMMKPQSEMLDHELQEDAEDETEVYIPSELDKKCKVKGLENYSHLIDGFEGRRVANPSEKLHIAYVAQEMAAATAKRVIEEESKVRGGLEAEIQQLEAQLEQTVKQESAAMENYRKKTIQVMSLEMEEPCRWNTTYQRLKRYVMKTGDMPPVPSACTTEEDRRLSIWVQEMKSLYYSKSDRIMNFPHRIEALEMLGIEWIESSEDRWNNNYKKLSAYKKRHGTAELPSFMQCRKSKDKDLMALRHWMDQQEQDVESGAIARRRDRLKKLQALGLPLELTWEQDWEYNITQLLKFRSRYGHLEVSGSTDSDLKKFVKELLARLKRGATTKLTKDEELDLRSKGLFDGLKGMVDGEANDGHLGPLIAEDVKLVPLDRVKEVKLWTHMLDELKAYQAQYNTLDFPPPGSNRGKGSGNRGIGKYAHLRDWVEEQRKAYHNKTLEESRINSLTNLGLDFDPWENAYQRLVQFKKEAGTARLPKVYKCEVGEEKDEELAYLCAWVERQTRIYRKGDMDSGRKKKLRDVGVYLTKGNMGKMGWEERFDEMLDFYHDNKTCLPQRNGPLRKWVLDLVDLLQNGGFVSAKRQKLIDKARIGPYLRPEVIFKSPSSGGRKKRRATPGDASGHGKKIRAEQGVAAV